jgi:hypothetical protein
LGRDSPCRADISGGTADGPFWAHHLAIANGQLMWVMELDDIFDDSAGTSPTVMSVALNGRCTAQPEQRYLAHLLMARRCLPSRSMLASFTTQPIRGFT